MKNTLVISLVLVLSNIAFGYSGGNGEPNNPYQIANVSDLLQLADDTNNYDKCFILTEDINLSGYVFDTAVIAKDDPDIDFGFNGTIFNGVFDGSGHVIRNLTINNSSVQYVGLFGATSENSHIKNLGLDAVNIAVSNGYTGGSLVGSNDGDINNCWSTGEVTGLNSFGGLVGANGGIISYCYYRGTASGGIDSTCIGGLVGFNVGSISKCFSNGTVITQGGSEQHFSYSTGGLVGLNGLGDYPSYDGFISNSYSTCSVNGGSHSSHIGGLVGEHIHGIIRNCYSSGVVTYGSGSEYFGGFLGLSHGNPEDINSCYFLNTSGPDNELGEPLSDANMKKQESFIGWDFIGETINGTEDIWWINEGYDYPKLVWQVFNNPNNGGGGGGSYNDWITVGSPQCWLGQYGNPQWKFQCFGDADNKTQDLSKFRVYTSDYNMLMASWGLKATQMIANPNPRVTICADFDHKSQDLSKFRVYTSDYTILIANWGKKETRLQPWCPHTK